MVESEVLKLREAWMEGCIRIRSFGGIFRLRHTERNTAWY